MISSSPSSLTRNKTPPESLQSVPNTSETVARTYVEQLVQATSCNDGQKPQKSNESAEDCVWQGSKTGLYNSIPGLPTLGKSC